MQKNIKKSRKKGGVVKKHEKTTKNLKEKGCETSACLKKPKKYAKIKIAKQKGDLL